MSFSLRLTVIALSPLAAIAVVLLSRSAVLSSAPDAAEALADLHKWLGVVAGLYVANFLIAWRYPASWPNFLVRSLVWAVIAYLCISNVIDLIGENWANAWQVFGGSGDGDPAVIASVRAGLSASVVGLGMAATCIALGFESSTIADSKKNDKLK